MDATINKIDCSSKNIAETNSLVIFLDAPIEGDCIGDGIRSDGKDPMKYNINRQRTVADGTPFRAEA